MTNVFKIKIAQPTEGQLMVQVGDEDAEYRIDYTSIENGESLTVSTFFVPMYVNVGKDTKGAIAIVQAAICAFFRRSDWQLTNGHTVHLDPNASAPGVILTLSFFRRLVR